MLVKEARQGNPLRNLLRKVTSHVAACLGTIARDIAMTRSIGLVFFLASSAFAQTTVTLNGQSYTLRPHPRVFFNSSIQSRIQDPDGTGSGVAPKAVNTNPPWTGTEWIVNNELSGFNNVNNQAGYRGGVEVASAAIQWYSDNTQTTSKTIALYMLNNFEQYIPLLCDEFTDDCIQGGTTGYGTTSYGASYWLPNWIFAYELMRGQMTAAQQEAFADKILNDTVAWGGVDGSPSTACTNPTVVSAVNVTVSNGTITAASPLFGSGYPIQANYWIAMDSSGANGYNYGKIASVTDATHAVISSGDASNFNGYSGVLAYRRNTWLSGDCGFLWNVKHDKWAAAAISDSTNYPPAGAQNGTAYYHNLVISSIWGMLPALLSVADDDVNYSSRASLEITALYNAWYTNTYWGINETYYSGRHQTGSTYGIWRATLFYPGIAFAVQNSTVSGPALTGGIWAKNMLYHYFMNWLPGAPANEPQWGQDFSSGPNFDVNGYGLTGVAELLAMYSTSNEGQWTNWWMQNVLSGNLFQNAPGANLSWSPSYYLWSYHNYGEYPFLYAWTDPAYATQSLSTAPTAATLSASDSGTTPTSMLISRTGYTSFMDTLVNLEAPSEAAQDHNLAQGGWTPGNYKIYKGYFLLGSDNGGYGVWGTSTGDVGNAGGPLSMYMEIGSTYNLTGSGQSPYLISLMPRADTDGTNNRFAYAMVDSTQAYLSSVNATRVHRHFVDFKKASTQQFIVVYDDAVTSSGQEKQTYLHYLNNNAGLTGQGSTFFSAGNTTTVSSTFSGFLGGNADAAQLLTEVLAPAGSNSVYTYVQNADGTYTGGNGDSFRVSICASSTGSSCDRGNTEGEFMVVHEPVAGTGNSLPAMELLATIDSNHRGVEIDGGSPKVAVFPRGGTTYANASFTTAHSGTAQYLVAGLVPGTYNVTVDGTSVVSGVVVSPSSDLLYFESISGSVQITPAADAILNITKTHTGNFTQGQQNAAYSVTVSNAASAVATSGTVTVNESVPLGLTLVSMTGAGWACGTGTCTRGDVLNGGSSYPPINIIINVANNATSPQVNEVSVSGGGSIAASATDSTNIISTPASVAATAGTPQSAYTNTVFATLLQATVTGTGGTPVSGATVTFTAPVTGASGAFAGGVNWSVTNAQGVATSAAFTANGATGSYTVTATVSGVATPATFSLVNLGTNYNLQSGVGAAQGIVVGQTATFSFTLISTPAPDETVGMSCSVAPPQANCILSQSVFPFSGSPQQFTVNVTTTSSAADRVTLLSHRNPFMLTLPAGLVLAMMSLPFVGTGAKDRRPSVGLLGTCVVVVLATVLLTGMVACGTVAGGNQNANTSTAGAGTTSPAQSSTPPGSYMLTITATPSVTGNPAQAIEVPFSVQ